jgi:outer membrane protein W
MKTPLTLLLLLIASMTMAQDSMSHREFNYETAAFKRNIYIVSASIGVVNSYRTNYSVPANFEKGTTTGFASFCARGEYAVSNRVSMAFLASFNTIYFNSFKLYTGYNGPIRRMATNKLRIISAGIGAYYHFGYMFHNDRFDPYVGGGLALNNMLHSAIPEGDSTIEQKSHTATPFLKLGARYYFSNKVNVFAEAGYDKLSAVNVGFSCRFNGK